MNNANENTQVSVPEASINRMVDNALAYQQEHVAAAPRPATRPFQRRVAFAAAPFALAACLAIFFIMPATMPLTPVMSLVPSDSAAADYNDYLIYETLAEAV